MVAKWCKGLYNTSILFPTPVTRHRASATASINDAIRKYYHHTMSPPSTSTKHNYTALTRFPSHNSELYKPSAHIQLITVRWGYFSHHLVNNWKIRHLPLKYYALGLLIIFHLMWTRVKLAYDNRNLDPTCTRCGQAPEDLEHMLWTCPSSQAIIKELAVVYLLFALHPPLSFHDMLGFPPLDPDMRDLKITLLYVLCTAINYRKFYAISPPITP